MAVPAAGRIVVFRQRTIRFIVIHQFAATSGKFILKFASGDLKFVVYFQ